MKIIQIISANGWKVKMRFDNVDKSIDTKFSSVICWALRDPQDGTNKTKLSPMINISGLISCVDDLEGIANFVDYELIYEACAHVIVSKNKKEYP